MDSSPNYNNYTLDELLDAKNHIDVEQYPERAKEIELVITNKMHNIESTICEDKKSVPWEFSGWLLLVGFGILISPFKLAFNIWTAYIPIFSNGTMEDVMVNGSLMFAAIVIAEIIVNISFFALSFYLIYLFLNKLSTFPKWYLITATYGTIFILVDSTVLSLMFPKLEIFNPEVIKNLATCVFSLIIWSPYLYMSERAKNTFTVNRT